MSEFVPASMTLFGVLFFYHYGFGPFGQPQWGLGCQQLIKGIIHPFPLSCSAYIHFGVAEFWTYQSEEDINALPPPVLPSSRTFSELDHMSSLSPTSVCLPSLEYRFHFYLPMCFHALKHEKMHTSLCAKYTFFINLLAIRSISPKLTKTV